MTSVSFSVLDAVSRAMAVHGQDCETATVVMKITVMSFDGCLRPVRLLYLTCAGFGQGSSSTAGDRLLLQLLLAARHLLSLQQPDSCTGIAGPLLSQLVKTFPAQLAAPAPAELAGVLLNSMKLLPRS